MSDAFDEREKGFETKFKIDEETSFKIIARRNKLLGLWLANHFGLDEDKATTYAKEVIIADMDEPGDEDVIKKVMADIKARGIKLSEKEVRDKISSLEKTATQEIKKDP